MIEGGRQGNPKPCKKGTEGLFFFYQETFEWGTSEKQQVVTQVTASTPLYSPEGLVSSCSRSWVCFGNQLECRGLCPEAEGLPAVGITGGTWRGFFKLGTETLPLLDLGRAIVTFVIRVGDGKLSGSGCMAGDWESGAAWLGWKTFP